MKFRRSRPVLGRGLSDSGVILPRKSERPKVRSRPGGCGGCGGRKVKK